MTQAAYRNGRARAPPGGSGLSFRLLSGRLPAWLEAAVAASVIAAVAAVAFLLVQMPGPLVVQVQDDAGGAVRGAQVTCESPGGDRRFSARTDGYGEAKWPGLAKGPWRCELLAPERFFGSKQEGSAVVESRHPATWRARIERPARLTVSVRRPPGRPRAAVAVRAVCESGTGTAESWEARAGVLDGNAVLWLPPGKSCRIGLVRPELPAKQPGPVPHPELSCGALPCLGPLEGGVGEELSAELRPSPEQWEAARPAPEPDSTPP